MEIVMALQRVIKILSLGFLCFMMSIVEIQSKPVGIRASHVRKAPPRRVTHKKKPTSVETDLATNTDLLSSLGKTHFIVGEPTKYVPPKKVRTTTVKPCDDLLCRKDGSVRQALFSPDDHLQDVLIDLINKEKTLIHIAVFSFTNGEIANALINAYRRGIDVCVLIDNSGVQDRFNKIERLRDAGIPVWIYKQAHTKRILTDKMHNKFVVFGDNLLHKPLVWTGSFNFTKSAVEVNQENVVVLDDRDIIERYNKQFTQLQKRSEPLKIT
jgi:phosphatidylserine/phosphatidylglycerophosphate/cardiolipin synthase-like enzyme